MFLFGAGFKYAIHDQDKSYFSFLRKRLPRVVVSFAIINTFFWMIDSIIWMERFDAVLLMKTYISSWLGNTVAYQLWYIPMYCLVLIVCTGVSKIIRSEKILIVTYLVIGIAQRVFEDTISFLSGNPGCFISYFLYYEMGIVAYNHGLAEKLSKKSWIVPGYFIAVVILSAIFPELSRSGIVEYLIYGILGTIVYFILSIYLRNSGVLHYFAKMSYPIFLLHEPLIGRSITAVLKRIPVQSVPVHFLVWLALDLLITLLVIKVISLTHFDRILWKYKIDKK